MTGKTVAHYRFFEKLGGGGMGVVYGSLIRRAREFGAETAVRRGVVPAP